MTDGVIDQMNITNASCVMHYSPPDNKTKFLRRLTTLAGTFTSSEVIMVRASWYIESLIYVTCMHCSPCNLNIIAAPNHILLYGRNKMICSTSYYTSTNAYRPMLYHPLHLRVLIKKYSYGHRHVRHDFSVRQTILAE